MEKIKCICGRALVKAFKVNNNKIIYLCPLCAYLIKKEVDKVNDGYDKKWESKKN